MVRMLGSWPAAVLLLLAAGACLFRSTDPDYGVGGYVRLADGTPLAGVAVQIRWPDYQGTMERTEVTDAHGHYRWVWVRDWYSTIAASHHVVLTPSRAGYSFEPASYDYRLDGVQEIFDFTATPVPAAVEVQDWLVIDWSTTVADPVRIGAARSVQVVQR